MNASLADVAVIVVNYGSSGLLKQNLEPLTTATGVRCLVVDNDSGVQERRRVTLVAAECGWTLVPAPDNDGFGSGVNLGVTAGLALGAEVFVVINPDARLEPDGLDGLVRAVRGAGRATLVAPRIIRPDGSVWSAGSDLYWSDGRVRSVAKRAMFDGDRDLWLSGACLAFDRVTWELSGGFADEYFLYWEDVDFSERVRRVGGRLMLLDGVTVVHAEGGTQGEGLRRAGQRKSDLYYFHNVRNRLLFGALWLDDAGWRQWLRHTPRVSWEILLQGGRRQFLSRPGVLLTGVRGMLAGYRLGRALRRGRYSLKSTSGSRSSPAARRRARSRRT